MRLELNDLKSNNYAYISIVCYNRTIEKGLPISICRFLMRIYLVMKSVY